MSEADNGKSLARQKFASYLRGKHPSPIEPEAMKPISELLANYNLDIDCHPGKANLMPYTLSRRRADVSGSKETQDLVVALANLHLCATTVDEDGAGLEALERADFLSHGITIGRE